MVVKPAKKGHHNERILIVGGGVAGLMTKNRLESLGYRPVLVEKADTLRTDGAGILLGANVLRIFRACGLEDALMRYAQPLREIVSLDDRARVLGRFDLEKIVRETTYPTVAVHRKRLLEILSDSVDWETIRLSKKVRGITQRDSVFTVTFDNDMTEEYDYIIGADGLRSNVREAFFGDIPLRDAGYVCWRFVCDMPEGLDATGSSEFWGNNKRVGIFPIGENKVYCFLLASTEGNEEAMDIHQVLDYFKEFQGDWQTILATLDANTTELLFNPIADLSKVVLQQGRMILIGDSGHATTPNLGQGAAMGIEGAYAFGELLKTHSLADAMKLYPVVRFDRVTYIRNRSWMIGKMAHLKSPFWQAVRNVVIRMTPRSVNQKEFEKAIFHQ
jgi:2-polyprenyl-6-methoxyphenol hydroxylase-like FAD-dependent oxidoreductase